MSTRFTYAPVNQPHSQPIRQTYNSPPTSSFNPSANQTHGPKMPSRSLYRPPASNQIDNSQQRSSINQKAQFQYPQNSVTFGNNSNHYSNVDNNGQMGVTINRVSKTKQPIQENYHYSYAEPINMQKRQSNQYELERNPPNANTNQKKQMAEYEEQSKEKKVKAYNINPSQFKSTKAKNFQKCCSCFDKKVTYDAQQNEKTGCF